MWPDNHGQTVMYWYHDYHLHQLQIVQRGHQAFRAGKTKSYAARLKHLKDVQRMIKEHKKDFIEAIRQDLNKVLCQYVLVVNQWLWIVALLCQMLARAFAIMAE